MARARGWLAAAVLLLGAAAARADGDEVSDPEVVPASHKAKAKKAACKAGADACGACDRAGTPCKRICEWLFYRPLRSKPCGDCPPCPTPPLFAYFLDHCAGGCAAPPAAPPPAEPCASCHPWSPRLLGGRR